MKQTMNKAQRDYLGAKARFEALVARQKEMEQAYIAAHGITNPDGGTPERIYCIDDDAIFEKANEEFSAEIVACGLEAEYDAARAALRAAEDQLIEYGFSLVPVGIRGTLEQAAKVKRAVRQQLLDLTLRLDVSTVPHQAGAQGQKGGMRHV